MKSAKSLPQDIYKETDPPEIIQEPPATNQQVIDPRKLTYEGPSSGFPAFVANLTSDQIAKAEQAELQMYGIHAGLQVEESSRPMLACCCPDCCVQSCFCLLCIFSCLIMMLFFWIILPVVYCCMKSKAEKVLTAHIDLQTYQAFQQLASQKGLRVTKAFIKIEDNRFTPDKVACLHQFIRQSGAGEVDFENRAIVINEGEEEWQNFEHNMSAIMRQPNLRCVARWHHKILQS